MEFNTEIIEKIFIENHRVTQQKVLLKRNEEVSISFVSDDKLARIPFKVGDIVKITIEKVEDGSNGDHIH